MPVDEWPPLPRLAMLGFQYAVMDAIYLVLVVIMMRHAQVSPTVGVNLLAVACLGLAIGAVLPKLATRACRAEAFSHARLLRHLSGSLRSGRAIGGMPLVFGMTLFAGAVKVLTAIVLKRLRVLITPVLAA